MNKNFIGAMLVSMAASAVMAADAPKGAVTPVKADAAVEQLCQNDSCKGKADCKGFGSASCKGQNTCKGMGHVNAKTAAECTKAHGKWTVTKK